MRLNRRPTLHTTAGVDSSIYWEFQPGERVMTREGVMGTVEAVTDGPFAGSEEYQVVLDAGLGGGAYASGELSPISGSTTALRASQGALTADIQGTTDPLEHWQQDEQADAEHAEQEKQNRPDLSGLKKLLPGLPEGAGAEDAALALAAALESHLASDDYPELGTILYDRPPIERVARKLIPLRDESGLGIEAEAGIMDLLFHPIQTIKDVFHHEGPHQDADFDWCRFRSGGHCHYPKRLDDAATSQAGYPVWVPEDRGPCPRLTTFAQQMCPVGAPGPHSGDAHALPEATQSWGQGGQRGGHPGEETTDLAPYRRASRHDGPDTTTCPLCEGRGNDDYEGDECSRCLGHKRVPTSSLTEYEKKRIASLTVAAAIDPELRFHFTSAWRDVQAKAKRIRSEGGVRIISTPDGRNPYITAEVNGDENVYQTTILRTMGGKSVAAWECGCAWSSYSWGRTGQWKKYEGRMCSHALATVYQAQADEIFGGRVKEIETKPIWSDQIRQPGSWDKDKGKHTGGLAPFEGAYTFDVDFSHSKDHLKNGEVVSGTHRISTDGANEMEARLIAEQMVMARGAEPTKVRRVSLHHVSTDPSLQAPPIQAMASAMLAEGSDSNEVMGYLVRMGAKNAVGILVTAMDSVPFKGTIGDEKYTFVKIEGDSAITDGGDRHPLDQIEHNDYDPHSGLDYHEAKLARGDDGTHVISPVLSPTPQKGQEHAPDNEHATDWESLSDEDRKGIQEHIIKHSPDPSHPITMDQAVQNGFDHIKRASERPNAVSDGCKWYRSAHEMTKQWGKQYGMAHHAAAGAMAGLSPNNSWENNVAQAHYLVRHLGANNHMDHEGDGVDRSVMRVKDAHLQGDFGKGKKGIKAKKDYDEVSHLAGKKFHDMSSDEAAAALHYQAKHVDNLRTSIGAPKKLPKNAKPGTKPQMPEASFGLRGNTTKAVDIARGTHPDKVLSGHKVRSFYNNIIDPHSNAHYGDTGKAMDSVTCDVHHLGAMCGAKYSNKGAAIRQMLNASGKGQAGRQKKLNVGGTYAFFAHATRLAHAKAQEAGLMPADSKPCDSQAVIWNEWKHPDIMGGKSRKTDEGHTVFPFADEKTGRAGPTGPPRPPKEALRNVMAERHDDDDDDEYDSDNDVSGGRTHIDQYGTGDVEDQTHNVIDPYVNPNADEPDPDIFPEENAKWHREHDGAPQDPGSKHESVLHLIADMMINEDPYPLQGGEAGGQLVNGVLPWGPDEWTGGDSGRPDEMDTGDDDDITRKEVEDAGDSMSSTALSHEDERRKHPHNCQYCHGIGCGLCHFSGIWEGEGPEDEPEGASEGAEGSLRATTHDHPEPALPTTDGLEEDEDPKAIRPGDPKLAWLMSGNQSEAASNHEIALAARKTVAKLALKDFTQAERAALIGEGEGTVTASNLDALDIAGTHYEALEANLRNQEDVEDDTWLS